MNEIPSIKLNKKEFEHCKRPRGWFSKDTITRNGLDPYRWNFNGDKMQLKRRNVHSFHEDSPLSDWSYFKSMLRPNTDSFKESVKSINKHMAIACDMCGLDFKYADSHITSISQLEHEWVFTLLLHNSLIEVTGYGTYSYNKGKSITPQDLTSTFKHYCGKMGIAPGAFKDLMIAHCISNFHEDSCPEILWN